MLELGERGVLWNILRFENDMLDSAMRFGMVTGVAQGIVDLYSQSPAILHRDLKSPNMLVAKNFAVKIGDWCLTDLTLHAQGFSFFTYVV